VSFGYSFVGLEAGAEVATLLPARYISNYIYIKANTFMGRPPGRIQSKPFQMRTSPEFLKAVDKWRAKQDDRPSRAEAIRRLVERGIKAKGK
jgi:hypothetical protein